jgi:hypothetical protein
MLSGGSSTGGQFGTSENGRQHPSLRFIDKYMIGSTVNFARRATLQPNLIKETVIPSAGITGVGLSMNVQSIALTKRAVDEDVNFARDDALKGSDPRENKANLTIASMVAGLVDGRANGGFVPITAPQPLTTTPDPNNSRFDPLMMYGRTIFIGDDGARDVLYKKKDGKMTMYKSSKQDRVFVGRLLIATEDYGIWALEHKVWREIGKKSIPSSKSMSISNVLAIPWVSETTPHTLENEEIIENDLLWADEEKAPITLKPTMTIGYSKGDSKSDTDKNATEMSLFLHEGEINSILGKAHKRNLDAIRQFQSARDKDGSQNVKAIRVYRLGDVVNEKYSTEKAVSVGLEKYFKQDVIGAFGYGDTAKSFSAKDISDKANHILTIRELGTSKMKKRGGGKIGIIQDERSNIHHESTIPVVGKTVALYEANVEKFLYPASRNRFDNIQFFDDKKKKTTTKLTGLVVGIHPLVLTLPTMFRPHISIGDDLTNSSPACVGAEYFDLPNTKYRFSISFLPELLNASGDDRQEANGIRDLSKLAKSSPKKEILRLMIYNRKNTLLLVKKERVFGRIVLVGTHPKVNIVIMMENGNKELITEHKS